MLFSRDQRLTENEWGPALLSHQSAAFIDDVRSLCNDLGRSSHKSTWSDWLVNLGVPS